jgi:hypothetical protein
MPAMIGKRAVHTHARARARDHHESMVARMCSYCNQLRHAVYAAQQLRLQQIAMLAVDDRRDRQRRQANHTRRHTSFASLRSRTSLVDADHDNAAVRTCSIGR